MRDRWITDWTPSARWPHYTRANAGEVLRRPASPLTVDYAWNRGFVPGWRDAWIQSGTSSLDEFDPDRPEVAGFFGGYFYINLANVRTQSVRNPATTVEQLDRAFFGDGTDIPPYAPHPDDERDDLMPTALAHIAWIVTTQDYPEIDQFRDMTLQLRRERADLTSVDDLELVAVLRAMQPLMQTAFHHHGVTSAASGVGPAILHAIGDVIDDPEVAMTICAGIGGVDSAAPSFRLWELSRLVRESAALSATFDHGVDGVLDRLRSAEASPENGEVGDFIQQWDAFLFEFGSRGPDEWELSSPTWETQPELALRALDLTRHQDETESPLIKHQARVTARANKIAETRTAVAELDNDDLAAQLKGAIVATNQLAFRERTKTNAIRLLHEARIILRELGRRHAEAGSLANEHLVFMLLDGELESFVHDPASLADELAARHREWLELHELEPPFMIVDGRVPPLSEWERKAPRRHAAAAVGDRLHGVPGCPGTVQGTARVIDDPSDPGALEPGDVLIAPVTDPSWTPLFMTAAAVVADVGGQISHAVIVSRELGIPCVVSVDAATQRIPDGATVEVDGSSGTITILALP